MSQLSVVMINEMFVFKNVSTNYSLFQKKEKKTVEL